MPVKILLADKSITIQKVVEMLFSGRDYEVACVSDGDTALNEAARIVPDVMLVDVDLPRIDGYSFAARIKQTPQLAQTPVVLMMSRDDVFDSAKGKQAGILDHIAKPFESQELIGKVKKALAAAPPRLAEPAPAPAASKTAPSVPRPAAPPSPPAATPRQATPSDIFEIIKEAPTQSELKQAASFSVEEESVYEVEPEVEEVEESMTREDATVLPVGAKAVEEMRAGLGLSEQPVEPQPEIIPFEAFDMAMETAPEAASPRASEPAAPISVPQPTMPSGTAVSPPTLPESELQDLVKKAVEKMAKELFAKMPPQISNDEVRSMVEATVSKMAKEAIEQRPAPGPPTLPEGELRSMAEKTISRMAEVMFKDMPSPPLPRISDETVRRGIEEAISKIARDIARDVIEKVAWEVIPPLAEQLIKEEIERLKAMQ
jgi:DNA-binding response OmpR family regulator